MIDLARPDRAAKERLLVERTQTDARTVLTVYGEIDVASVHELERQLEAAQRLAPRELVIDLDALTFMDSTGLYVLLRAYRNAKSNGYSLMLRRVPDHAMRLLRLTGVVPLFRVID
jgi:anti-sigma B factor antagonist